VAADLATFVAVAAVVIVTPGPDTALTIRNTLAGGRRGGALTALGVASGQACWTVAAAGGVAALLVASEPAFLALKLAGAAYLVWLGAQSLWAAFRPRARRSLPRSRPAGAALAFRQGLVSNLGNPKMAVFFTSLLPQFAGDGRTSFAALLGLGLLFCGLTLAWLGAYAVAVARAGDALRRPRVRRVLDAVTGAVLVALGVRVATERP
jgi:threonine/homoserine/homoserine lactone efflux protein